MPRSSGVYSEPAGTKGTPNTTIQSAPYNAFVDDLVAEANGARPITAGGTGSTNATAAREALGLKIGTNIQAYDELLQAIAGLVTVADRLIYTTGADMVALTTLTAFGRSLIDDADAAAGRTTLGLGSISTLNGINDANWSGADLSIANGGTGASTAAAALTALGAAPAARTVTAGTGLSGGGALTANIAFSVDYGTAAGTAAQGNDTRIVNAVQTSRTITAGNGLTGGGTLAADRAVALGTPTTLSASTTNTVGSTTHAHDVDVASIAGAGNAALSTGAQGTWGLFRFTGSGTLNNGSVVAGSQLEYARVTGDTNGVSPGGSWMCDGTCVGGGGSGSTTVFHRR